MEIVGFKPFKIYSTLHGPGYSGSQGLASIFAFDTESASHDYHVFAAEWEPQAVRFYVDGVAYATKTPADLPPGARWVFDHPFFIVLNMAVGGNLAGSPDESTVLPQRMLVDYVRVYARP
jgi:beta-glucanase (GH16 family)